MQDFETMLDELADAYPQLKDQAAQLKTDVLELMPEEDAMPEEEPELDTADIEAEEELSL